MSLQFIDIVDQTGRTSSIAISDKHPKQLQIVGVLNHCDLIRPKTQADAMKLINWLSSQCYCSGKFQDNNGTFHDDKCPKRIG